MTEPNLPRTLAHIAEARVALDELVALVTTGGEEWQPVWKASPTRSASLASTWLTFGARVSHQHLRDRVVTRFRHSRNEPVSGVRVLHRATMPKTIADLATAVADSLGHLKGLMPAQQSMLPCRLAAALSVVTWMPTASWGHCSRLRTKPSS